jgi:hypothetical protein
MVNSLPSVYKHSKYFKSNRSQRRPGADLWLLPQHGLPITLTFADAGISGLTGPVKRSFPSPVEGFAHPLRRFAYKTVQ